MFLHFNNVSYRYPGSGDPVFEALTFTFASGWTGIVGDNGCGKSTIVGVAAGRLAPSAGSVSGCASAVVCPQDCAEEPEMSTISHAIMASKRVICERSCASRTICRGGFQKLSCGEQKKIQVAVALWRSPDLLVLDEPTNHVDAACKAQLIEVLRGFKGVGLLVSHDRGLLDELASGCLMCEFGVWTMRPGGYAQARREVERERAEVVHRKLVAARRAKRLEAEARVRSEKAACAAARRSKRALDVHDSDARARIDLAIFSGQDGRAGKLARRMTARADGARADEAKLRVRKTLRRIRVVRRCSPHARHDGASPRRQHRCGDSSLTFGDLRVDAGEKIGVVGRNGAGKSTLIRHIMAQLTTRYDPHDVLYVPQELTRELRVVPARVA